MRHRGRPGEFRTRLRPADQLVPAVEDGRRMGDPERVPCWMAKRGEVQKLSHAAPCLSRQCQGLQHEGIAETTAVGWVGDDVAGSRFGLAQEIDATLAEASFNQIRGNDLLSGVRQHSGDVSQPARRFTIGIPDAERGQIVKAFVLTRRAPTDRVELIADLQSHVRAKLGGYKVPREFEFVADLPVTTSGKVSRKELRARDAQRRQIKG